MEARAPLGGEDSGWGGVVGDLQHRTATKQCGELEAQLEGTENGITVARGRYIKAVQQYNVLAREFPSNLTAKMFGYHTKANFTVENEKALAVPPKVDFSHPAPAKN